MSAYALLKMKDELVEPMVLPEAPAVAEVVREMPMAVVGQVPYRHLARRHRRCLSRLTKRAARNLKALTHLRRKSIPVDFSKVSRVELEAYKEFLTNKLKEIGVGIQGNQKRIRYNILLLWVKARKDAEGYAMEREELDPVFMINPVIVAQSDRVGRAPEQCLSLPDEQVIVERYLDILVGYYDIDGNYQEKWLHDFHAVLFQHEFDHTQGVLITDYARKPMTWKEYNLKHQLILKHQKNPETDIDHDWDRLLSELDTVERDPEASKEAQAKLSGMTIAERPMLPAGTYMVEIIDEHIAM